MKKCIYLVIILCFLLSLKTSAQYVLEDIVTRANNSTYIFEGEVLETNCYWNIKHDYILTSNTVRIKKNFKGNLQCGTVEIITLGGTIGEYSVIIDHNLVLSSGQVGIFLCKDTKREQSVVDFYPETNTQVLQTYQNEQGYIKFSFDGVNPEVVDYWQFHLDDLADMYNLLYMLPQVNYVDCNPAPIPPPSNTGPQTMSTDTNLYVRLENPQKIMYQGKASFQFEVQIMDSINNIYFVQSQFRFLYDTLTFGKRIFANGKLHVFPMGILTDTASYREGTSGGDDIVLDNIGVVQTRFNFWQSTSHHEHIMNFAPLSTNYISVAKVIIEIKHCENSSVITPYIGGSTLANHYSLIDSNVTPNAQYDMVVSDSINYQSCGISYISSVLPNPVHGGVGDTVTITGKGFGAARGDTGNVLFAKC